MATRRRNWLPSDLRFPSWICSLSIDLLVLGGGCHCQSGAFRGNKSGAFRGKMPLKVSKGLGSLLAPRDINSRVNVHRHSSRTWTRINMEALQPGPCIEYCHSRMSFRSLNFLLFVLSSLSLPLHLFIFLSFPHEQTEDNTLPKTFPEVLHHFPSHLRRNGVDFLSDPFLQILKSFPLEYPIPRWIFQGFVYGHVYFHFGVLFPALFLLFEL